MVYIVTGRLCDQPFREMPKQFSFFEEMPRPIDTGPIDTGLET